MLAVYMYFMLAVYMYLCWQCTYVVLFGVLVLTIGGCVGVTYIFCLRSVVLVHGTAVYCAYFRESRMCRYMVMCCYLIAPLNY